ncbi:MAG: hypothetical protein ACLQKY_03080 [Terracidiphilus sp.]
MDAQKTRQKRRTPAAIPSSGDRLHGATMIGGCRIQRLDIAILERALHDLWRQPDGRQLKRVNQQKRAGLVLDAARWCFADDNPGYVFSFRRICQRLGIDPLKGAFLLFLALPANRRRQLWRALRQHPNALMPSCWQACQQMWQPADKPEGRRYR